MVAVSPPDYSPAFTARFIGSFLDAVGAESAVVVGNSFGGLVALHLALSEPERVSMLVLADSGQNIKRLLAFGGRGPRDLAQGAALHLPERTPLTRFGRASCECRLCRRRTQRWAAQDLPKCFSTSWVVFDTQQKSLHL